MRKKSKDFIRVDEWYPKKEDIKIDHDGMLMIVPFNEIFNREDIPALNRFVVEKKSYSKRLDEVTLYLNYFIKFYNNEILLSYLKLKFIIDNKNNKNKILDNDNFEPMIYNILFSNSVIQSIWDMVEDNYYIDLSSPSEKEYNESLEFTNEHAKILMCISIGIKIMIPVLFHYLYTFNKLKTDKSCIPRFYDKLFDIFGKNVDIYNKLYISVASKVNVNYLRNKLIWEQREIFGVNVTSETEKFLRVNIITEIMFRYRFHKNIISFNHVILNSQLVFFILKKYDENRIEMSTKKDPTGLSGVDKMEMNSAKIDESSIVMSSINIDRTINKIKNKMKIEITDEELNYYIHNTEIVQIQYSLVYYFYAKEFKGYHDMYLLNRTQYMKLLILLKKRLQYEGSIYLPQILSGNPLGRINKRSIQNSKFLTKIETSSLYESIYDKFLVISSNTKDNIIIHMLSTLLNTAFTFVDFDHQEYLGNEIEVNHDTLSHEFLSLINQI